VYSSPFSLSESTEEPAKTAKCTHHISLCLGPVKSLLKPWSVLTFLLSAWVLWRAPKVVKCTHLPSLDLSSVKSQLKLWNIPTPSSSRILLKKNAEVTLVVVLKRCFKANKEIYYLLSSMSCGLAPHGLVHVRGASRSLRAHPDLWHLVGNGNKVWHEVSSKAWT